MRIIRTAPVLFFVSNIDELGSPAAQRLVLTDRFYWDHNDRTRAFARRLEPFQSRYPWDYCALISQLPANDAFRPVDLGGCPLIKL